jgi:hypothetical protein
VLTAAVVTVPNTVLVQHSIRVGSSADTYSLNDTSTSQLLNHLLCVQFSKIQHCKAIHKHSLLLAHAVLLTGHLLMIGNVELSINIVDKGTTADLEHPDYINKGNSTKMHRLLQ